MKTRNNKKEQLYQVDADIIREETSKMHLIAGNNLQIYRNHCQLTFREAYFQSNISYSQIYTYEKNGVKNMDVYFYLMRVYQALSQHLELGEPEGIIHLFTH